ncbi:hypothetical protein ACQEV2_41725 [Streptomyces sp. CA-251387]|uniref:hypothetical protein n=1 Tax=Streptomyces sp. CA-251387 TaxID=3240064 RepID=UPI003D8FFFD6
MSWLIAPVPALVLALVFSVFAGVVLPAVWSTQPARRQAAAAVLAQLLRAGRDVDGSARPSGLSSSLPAAPADHPQAHSRSHHWDNDTHGTAS